MAFGAELPGFFGGGLEDPSNIKKSGDRRAHDIE
jgi:hypothetical protein